MSKTLTVTLSGPLRQFRDKRSRKNGLDENVSGNLRDPVRCDFEKEDARKWSALIEELKPALMADESEYVPFDAEAIIRQVQVEYAEESA